MQDRGSSGQKHSQLCGIHLLHTHSFNNSFSTNRTNKPMSQKNDIIIKYDYSYWTDKGHKFISLCSQPDNKTKTVNNLRQKSVCTTPIYAITTRHSIKRSGQKCGPLSGTGWFLPQPRAAVTRGLGSQLRPSHFGGKLVSQIRGWRNKSNNSYFRFPIVCR